MDQIAEAADVSKQTVYSHFQSKEALFLGFVHAMTGAAGDDVYAHLSDPPTGIRLEDFLLEFGHKQLAIVLTPRLMQLRRMAIGEAGRFPELGITLHKMGPGRAIGRLENAFGHYRATKQLEAVNLKEAASNFNWLLMGAPVNDAMMLGDGSIPTTRKLKVHVAECVRIFVAAYGIAVR